MKLETVRYAVAVMMSVCVAPSGGSAQAVDGYSPVTDQRLENPDPGDWLTYRRTYDGWGYSPLDQIDAGNVGELVPKWSFATDMPEGHEAPPIVNDGIMFITTPGAQVFALDARDGDLLWRYKRQLPDGLTQMHPTNRGVGLYGDKVFVTTVDAYLVALDARTGRVVWETAVEDFRSGYYMNAGAARGPREGHGGSLGRRVRHSWLRAGVRRGGRHVGVEDLHDSRSR